MYDGLDVARLDVEERVEHGFCLVPETRELFGDMTVADNLVLGAYSRRRNGADRSSLQRSLWPFSAARRAPAAESADTLGRRAADAGARPRLDGASRGC